MCVGVHGKWTVSDKTTECEKATILFKLEGQTLQTHWITTAQKHLYLSFL